MVQSIELFSGAGGLAIGLQKAGLSHKLLVEWDKYSCENIELNIKKGFQLISDWVVENKDVRTIDFTQYKGKVDVISGGPPCQPFSLGGKSKAYNDKRDMWPEAIRAVREIEPKAFIFENVKGLLRASFNDYFQYIILQLRYPKIEKGNDSWEKHYKKLVKIDKEKKNEDLYEITYRLVNVADYGVPQSRYRVFIIGFRKDLHIDYVFPEGDYSKDALLYDKWVSGEYWKEHGLSAPKPSISKQKIQKLADNPPNLKRWRTVRDAIADLSDPNSKRVSDKVKNHEYRAGAKCYAGHSGSSLDEPSKTIKAGVHGVPGGENMVVLDDGSVRYYTVRESARIQTFDDSYEFGCPWGEAMRQIGNAVPVKMAEVVGKSVVEQLERGKKMAIEKEIPIIEPYNPLDKQNIGNSIANELMNNGVQNLPPEPFIGAGVYAIFYLGDNSTYAELAKYNRQHDCAYPIYVGKAVPQGARKGGVGAGDNQGSALLKRLGDHAKSINDATDLKIEDFRCRYIVVDDIWIPLAESLMISRYKPVWNSVIDGFGNHDPGSGRKGQVQSQWDMLHPGRSWAKKLPAGPKDQATLRRLVDYYFKTNEILNR